MNVLDYLYEHMKIVHFWLSTNLWCVCRCVAHQSGCVRILCGIEKAHGFYWWARIQSNYSAAEYIPIHTAHKVQLPAACCKEKWVSDPQHRHNTHRHRRSNSAFERVSLVLIQTVYAPHTVLAASFSRVPLPLSSPSHICLVYALYAVYIKNDLRCFIYTCSRSRYCSCCTRM